MPKNGSIPIGLHADADDHDARAGRGAFHDLLDHARDADAFEDHAGLLSRSDIEQAREPARVVAGGRRGVRPGFVGRSGRGIDDDVGAHALRQRAPRRRKIRRDDRVRAFDLQAGDHRQADRAAADHQRHVVGRQSRELHRVPADRDRFGQRGVLGGQAVRHLQQHPVRQRHELAIAAGDLVVVADAQYLIAAQRHGHGTNQRAGFQPLRRVRVRDRRPRNKIHGRTPRRAPGPCPSVRRTGAPRSTNCRVCFAACRSEPQMPQRSVFTSTWPCSGTGSGNVSTLICPSRKIGGAHDDASLVRGRVGGSGRSPQAAMLSSNRTDPSRAAAISRAPAACAGNFRQRRTIDQSEIIDREAGVRQSSRAPLATDRPPRRHPRRARRLASARAYSNGASARSVSLRNRLRDDIARPSGLAHRFDRDDLQRQQQIVAPSAGRPAVAASPFRRNTRDRA